MLKKKNIFLVFFIFFCLFGISQITKAETAAELQAKIDGQNKSLQAIEAEIAGYQKQLTVIGNNKNTLSNTIKTLTLESQKLKADIAVSQNKISTTNYKIESLASSIDRTTGYIEDFKTALGKSIRELNSQDYRSLNSILVSSASLSNLWHYNAEQDAFHKGIQQKTKQLQTTKEALVISKTSVEQAKKELVAINTQLENQKKVNQTTQAEKNSLLKSTKNQEATYQKMLAQKLALKTQMEADLGAYEAKLKYVLNPKLLPPAGTTPFSWPVDHIVITQLFGRTVAAARLYVSGSHNGVDFGVPVGTPVKAMATGTVVASGNSDLSCPGASYGKWVFIKYGNGLASVYGHLSLVSAASGTTVTAGDIVAYSGATGYATGPHLHVSVFPNDGVSVNSFKSKACPGRTITIPTAAVNAYLDPMLYLPKSH